MDATTTGDPVDMQRLTAEINAEVRRRRAAGDFPPGLERELDAMFARYAPATTGGDFDEVVEAAERTSFVHADVPTASNQPLLSYVKRGLRMIMAWYVRFLAQQVTAFAGAITRSVRLLGHRVDTLERVTVKAAERTLAEITERRAGPDLSPWTDIVSQALTGLEGRVLHAECGDGTLLTRLVADGRDAYGVEPTERLAMAAAQAGLDVRADDALTHLRAVPDAALAGLVLSGAVDCLPLGSVLELADLAAAKLGAAGVLAVISVGPAAWARSLDPVLADLSPGRPLHPETWTHLLAARGFACATVHSGPTGGGELATVPPTVAGAETINANVERLNQLLFAPASYAVSARRP
jgi:Methionine biosynthesis protein MetW